MATSVNRYDFGGPIAGPSYLGAIEPASLVVELAAP